MRRSNSLTYAYIFLLAFQIFNICIVRCAKLEGKLSEVEEFEHHSRQKRFLPLLLAGAGALFAGISAGADIASAVKDEPPQTPTVVVNCGDNCNVQIEELATSVATDVKKVSDGIYRGKVKKNRYCNADFCDQLGRLGEAAFGPKCNNKYCHCDTGRRAHLKSCGKGTVFDPVHMICNWPDKVGC